MGRVNATFFSSLVFFVIFRERRILDTSRGRQGMNPIRPTVRCLAIQARRVKIFPATVRTIRKYILFDNSWSPECGKNEIIRGESFPPGTFRIFLILMSCRVNLLDESILDQQKPGVFPCVSPSAVRDRYASARWIGFAYQLVLAGRSVSKSAAHAGWLLIWNCLSLCGTFFLLDTRYAFG